jgi:hypothetical protein
MKGISEQWKSICMGITHPTLSLVAGFLNESCGKLGKWVNTTWSSSTDTDAIGASHRDL